MQSVSLAGRLFLAERVRGHAILSTPWRFSFAPRAGGWFLSCHCVTASSCHAGARPLGACSPAAGGIAALRDSLDRDPAARPVPGPLGVRTRRRHRHPVRVRALGPRGLGRHGRWHPPGGGLPPPQDVVSLGGGHSLRRCRGWSISPEPAGTGRASPASGGTARLCANAEGPRCGSRPAEGGIAGKGVCGRSGWGDARPHPATRGTGKTKASGSEERASRARAWRVEHPRRPYVVFQSGWRHGAGEAGECSSKVVGATI
jgi:hypothetical protein